MKSCKRQWQQISLKRNEKACEENMLSSMGRVIAASANRKHGGGAANNASLINRRWHNGENIISKPYIEAQQKQA
jgi:hypothetical protein